MLVPPFTHRPETNGAVFRHMEPGQIARRVAQRVQAEWHKLGHTGVRAWVESESIKLPPRLKLVRGARTEDGSTVRVMSDEEVRIVWHVRSNLLNGLPPKAETLAAE